MNEKGIFVHHVFFWLKNPDSSEDLAQLTEGLRKLTAVNTIRSSHIGKPADTDRPVIERSYSLSWMVLFNSKEEHDSYQSDPIHLKFVDDCKHLWGKIVIYDSVDA